MRRILLLSIVVGCALGCAREGEPGTEALSPDDPRLVDSGAPLPEGCETICASYDSSECRVVCTPPPPDASIPDDPYGGDGDAGIFDPDPQPVDSGVPDPGPDPHADGGCEDPEPGHDPYAS